MSTINNEFAQIISNLMEDDQFIIYTNIPDYRKDSDNLCFFNGINSGRYYGGEKDKVYDIVMSENILSFKHYDGCRLREVHLPWSSIKGVEKFLGYKSPNND